MFSFTSFRKMPYCLWFFRLRALWMAFLLVATFASSIPLQLATLISPWSLNKCQCKYKGIGNDLKTSKKWNTQSSWNGTIVLINKTITKVVCFKCYNHKIMAYSNYQSLKVLCAFKTMWGENKKNSKPLQYILFPNPKVAAI